MTLNDAKKISDTYGRLMSLRTFLERGKMYTQSYTLTETDREGILPITISISHDQVEALLKELEKELDILQSALDHSQIVKTPNELTMGIKNNG